MRAISLIVVHHSASPLTTTAEQIRRWHTLAKPNGRGWRDIGYQAVIEGDGALLPGRPIDRVGAHARGANTGSLGVCVVGNNLDPGLSWVDAQIESLDRFLFVTLGLFPGSKIAGHCDVGKTATGCPGLDVRRLFPQYPAASRRGRG